MTLLGRLGHRLVANEVVSLGRLKWLGIVAPLAALLLLVVLLRSSLHDWLHESPGVYFLGALFAIAVFTFASVIFALIEDLERRVFDQNGELSELLAHTDRQNAELSALLDENVRLHDQVLDRAVLEERERIARELHDGLAQVLGYMNTQTQAVKKLLESGRLGEASDELAAMGTVSRDVYGDVREAIVGLRAVPRGLVPAVREYLTRLPLPSGCTIELLALGDVEEVELAPSTEIQLVRIVQEALSNVRKHAAATHVDVIVEARDGEIGIEVVDDGGGFDPRLSDRTGWPRLGIQTMRERALAVGGSCAVVSAPGGGTRVVVNVPVTNEQEVVGARAAR
jgi:signal transduction histidine kinase